MNCLLYNTSTYIVSYLKIMSFYCDTHHHEEMIYLMWFQSLDLMVVQFLCISAPHPQIFNKPFQCVSHVRTDQMTQKKSSNTATMINNAVSVQSHK